MTDKQYISNMMNRIGYEFRIDEYSKEGCEVASIMKIDVPILDYFLNFNFNDKDELISIEE